MTEYADAYARKFTAPPATVWIVAWLIGDGWTCTLHPSELLAWEHARAMQRHSAADVRVWSCPTPEWAPAGRLVNRTVWSGQPIDAHSDEQGI